MITTGNPIVSIYTEMTPNPSTMKFVANKLLYPGKSIDFQDETLATPSPLAKELFSFPFIKSVFIASNFITLTKTEDVEDWQDVIPSVKQFLKDYLEKGGVVVNDDEVAKGFGGSVGVVKYFPLWKGNIIAGFTTDFWNMKTEWKDGIQSGETKNLVVQPWINSGYLYDFSNKFNAGLTLGFGREINTFNRGEEVGQGWMGILTISANYSIN